jgi:hypothetical protein
MRLGETLIDRGHERRRGLASLDLAPVVEQGSKLTLVSAAVELGGEARAGVIVDPSALLQNRALCVEQPPYEAAVDVRNMGNLQPVVGQQGTCTPDRVEVSLLFPPQCVQELRNLRIPACRGSGDEVIDNRLHAAAKLDVAGDWDMNSI